MKTWVVLNWSCTQHYCTFIQHYLLLFYWQYEINHHYIDFNLFGYKVSKILPYNPSMKTKKRCRVYFEKKIHSEIASKLKKWHFEEEWLKYFFFFFKCTPIIFVFFKISINRFPKQIQCLTEQHTVLVFPPWISVLNKSVE